MKPVVIPASTAIAIAAWIERCGRPVTPNDQRLALAFVATLRQPTTLELEEADPATLRAELLTLASEDGRRRYRKILDQLRDL